MRFVSIIFTSVVVLILIGCPGPPPTCTSPSYLILKKWRLQEYRIDNTVQTSDISKYNITFTKPDHFSRTGITNSQDEGSWQLKNGDKALTLTSSSLAAEEYIIDSITENKLVLVITMTDSKTGNKQHMLTLIPA